MRKKGLSSVGTFVGIALLIIFFLMATAWLTGWNVPRILNILFPDFVNNNSTNAEIEDYGFGCKIKVADITENGEIKFVNGDKIPRLKIDSKEVIKLNGVQIGSTIKGSFISIEVEVMNGYGKKFYDNEADLPSYENLLALRNSYFPTSAKKELCKNEEVTLEQEREKIFHTTKDLNVGGKIFYFNMDNFIKNKSIDETPLYLDSKLTKKANSYIFRDGNIYRFPEEDETTFEPVSIDKKDEIDPSIPDFEQELKGKLIMNEFVELENPIPNKNGELGVNTGGDPFTQVSYKSYQKRNWIKFADDDSLSPDDVSPWILVEYWYAYGTFARAPEDWAIMRSNPSSGNTPPVSENYIPDTPPTKNIPKE